MRWLFWVLLIMAMAMGVSLLASNQGYVLIVVPPYRLELSLNLLLILIALTFTALHLGLRLFNYTKNLPASVRARKEEQRQKNAHNAMLEALNYQLEGRYTLAERSASAALDLGESTGLSSLIAARASHKLHHKSQRDYYFAEAERIAPDAAVARLLSQAELYLDDRQYALTVSTLQKLEKIEPKYPPAMRLELKAQLRLNHWEQVLELLQQLEKRNAIETWQLTEIRQQVHINLINRIADDLPSLSNYWKKLPDDQKLNPRLAKLAASCFIALNDGKQAAEILEMSLTKRWNSELAGMLGDCITDNPTKQLQQAEFWLLSHEADANLLLSLGNMCAHLDLWGKAQSYLEASISVAPSAAAHIALAKLLEGRGETEAANAQYRLSTRFLDAAE